jgi:hypothetical protein
MRDNHPSTYFGHDNTSDAIRAAGPAAMLVASFLSSNSSVNSIGFYRLPLEAISAATSLPLGEAQAAMHVLEQVGFARYHAASEMVWIINWTRQKLGKIRANNKKRIALANAEYAAIPRDCLMRVDFLWKNARMLHLKVAGSAAPNTESLETEAEMPPDLFPQRATEPGRSVVLSGREI